MDDWKRELDKLAEDIIGRQNFSKCLSDVRALRKRAEDDYDLGFNSAIDKVVKILSECCTIDGESKE